MIRTRSMQIRRFSTVGAAALLACLGMATASAGAKAASPAFGPKESPLGRTYAGWFGEWTKWAFAGPALTNPLLSVQACDSWTQPEPTKAWYLSANGPGTADVTCSVPADVPIALTPGGIFDWQTPGNEAKLTEYLKTFPTSVRKPTLSVDGVKVDATKYLVTTPVIKTTIVAPEFGPRAGADKGELSAIGKGWMLVLKGLKAGPHTVVITDQLSNIDDSGKPILVNGKPSWLLSRVNYTLNAGAGPAAAPATTAAPALVAAPSKAALFKDDFGDAKSGWLDDNGGGWTMGYTEGKYKIAVDPGNGGHVGPGHAGQPNLRNTHIEIDFELTTGEGAMVIHCYDASIRGINTDNTASTTTEPEHLYVAVSPKAGSSAYVSIGGKRTKITGANDAALTAAFIPKVNRLAVDCSGESGQPGRVKMSLNGTPILDAQVAVMPSGAGVSPSLEAFRGLTARGELVIDNLVVTAL
jgi:hypothetical protein